MRMHTTIVAAATACLTGGLLFFYATDFVTAESVQASTPVERDQPGCGCGNASADALAHSDPDCQDTAGNATTAVPQQDEDLATESTSRLPELVWEGSDLLALFYTAFQKLGQPDREAMILAKFAREAVTSGDNPVADWRTANPYEVIRDGFVGVGMSQASAAHSAVDVLQRMGFREPAPDDFKNTSVDESEDDHGQFDEAIAKWRATDGARHIREYEEERRSSTPSLVWEGSDLLALFLEAFKKLGIDEDRDMPLAKAAYEAVNPSDRAGGTTDWRNANPYAIFQQGFTAVGIPGPEASVLSYAVLREMGLRRTLTGAQEDCHAYPVKIIWCEGEKRKSTVRFIHKPVWDTVRACTKPAGWTCVSPNTTWYTMTATSACNGEFPPAGACFWITENGPDDWIDCSPFILERECIEELDPQTDCGAIEVECGDQDDGPEGCPSCD